MDLVPSLQLITTEEVILWFVLGEIEANSDTLEEDIIDAVHPIPLCSHSPSNG